MLSPDTILQNRYRVIRAVGQGGMGSVYQAIDERLSLTIALKEALFRDGRMAKAFTREARLLANLRHPMLPKVMDYFYEGSGQFLVMEFIQGDDLGRQLKMRASPFDLGLVLNWGDQLLSALEYLHTLNPPVIHRDIKPYNLKLMSDGRIILLDFGLSKGSASDDAITASTSSVFGFTPQFAPIEQIQGVGTDPRSDLYSLAATLYNLLTGHLPINAVTRASAVLEGHDDPMLPAHKVLSSIPNAVGDVLIKAMSLNRNNRFASAGYMRDALKEASRDVTIIRGVLGEASNPALGDPPLKSIPSVFPNERAISTAQRTEPQSFTPIKERTVLLDQLTVHMRPSELESSQSNYDSPQTILLKHSEVLTQQDEHVFEELILHQDYERLWRSLIHVAGGRNLLTGYGPFGGTSLIRCAVAKARTELQKLHKREGALLVFYFSISNETKEHFHIEATNMGFSHVQGLHDLNSNTDFNELKELAGHKQGEITSAVIELPLNEPIGATFFATRAKNIQTDTTRSIFDFTQLAAELNAFFKQKKSSKALRRIVMQLVRSENLPARVVFIIDKIKHLETLESLSQSELFSNKRVRVIAIARKEDFDIWEYSYRRLKAMDFSKWYVPCLWNIDWSRALFKNAGWGRAEMEKPYNIFLKHLEYKGRGSLGNILAELRHPMNTNYANDHSFIEPVSLVDRAEIQHNSWIQEFLDLNWFTILGDLFVGADQDEMTDRARIGIYLFIDWLARKGRFRKSDAVEESKNISISISDDDETRVEAIDNLLNILIRNRYLSLKDNVYRVIWKKNRAPRPHKVNIKRKKKVANSAQEYLSPQQSSGSSSSVNSPTSLQSSEFEVPDNQELSSPRNLSALPSLLPNTQRKLGRIMSTSEDTMISRLVPPPVVNDAAPSDLQLSEATTQIGPSATPSSKKIFVSYSHVDREWLIRLHVHMKPFERDGVIDLWDDRKIKTGDKWHHEIKKAISSARIAILLISAQFLASDFIVNNELPPLLEASEKGGTLILPIILSPVRLSNTYLSQFQAINDPATPLTAMDWNQQEALFVKVTEFIEKVVR